MKKVELVCDVSECGLLASYALEVPGGVIMKCLRHGKEFNKNRPTNTPKIPRVCPSQCEAPGCPRTPYYGSPIGKFHMGIPKRCFNHAKKSDISTFPKMCINCLCRVGTHGKRGTRSSSYCSRCAGLFRSTTNNVIIKLIDYILEKLEEGNQKKIEKGIACFELLDKLEGKPSGVSLEEVSPRQNKSEESPAVVWIESYMNRMLNKIE